MRHKLGFMVAATLAALTYPAIAAEPVGTFGAWNMSIDAAGKPVALTPALDEGDAIAFTTLSVHCDKGGALSYALETAKPLKIKKLDLMTVPDSDASQSLALTGNTFVGKPAGLITKNFSGQFDAKGKVKAGAMGGAFFMNPKDYGKAHFSIDGFPAVLAEMTKSCKS
jgi:hypothetical protein